MSDANLRSSLIRLAHTKPELRGEILPLLKRAAAPVHPGHAILRKFLPKTETRHKFVILASGGRWTEAWKILDEEKTPNLIPSEKQKTMITEFIDSI